MRRSTSISRSRLTAGLQGGVLPWALLLAGAGSLLILLDLFGAPARAVGLVAVIAGTVLAAPFADRPGAASGSWWTMLAAGSALALAGTAVALGIDTLGGLLAVVGGALVAVGAVLGYPAR